MSYEQISEIVTTTPLSEKNFNIEKDGTVFNVKAQNAVQTKTTVYEEPTSGFGWGLLGLFLVIAALVATPLVCALVSGSLAIALPVGIGAFLLGFACIGVGAYKHNKSTEGTRVVIQKTENIGHTGEKGQSKDIKQETTKELLSEQQETKTNNSKAEKSTCNLNKQNKGIL